MIRTLSRLTVAVATLTLAPVLAGPAHAERLESADRDVSTVRVSYIERMGRTAYIELSNGAAYKLSPCRYEDGRQCYWSGSTMGNRSGRSFVVVAGRVHYLTRALSVDLATTR